MAFSPDGARVLSGSDDKTIKLWDAATGALIRTFEGHSITRLRPPASVPSHYSMAARRRSKLALLGWTRQAACTAASFQAPGKHGSHDAVRDRRTIFREQTED